MTIPLCLTDPRIHLSNIANPREVVALPVASRAPAVTWNLTRSLADDPSFFTRNAKPAPIRIVSWRDFPKEP